jgi:hypothetical protein
LIGPERVLALGDELVIHLVRAHDVVELLEREVEDVLPLTKHVGLDEALGFFQQGLLIDEVAADEAAFFSPSHSCNCSLSHHVASIAPM